MMAGDVSAVLSGGTLFLNEASGSVGTAQSVQVTQLSNFKFRVTGATLPSNPGGTKINGQDSLVFDSVNKIDFHLGGGSDNVQFLGSLNGFSSLNIDVGDPSNGLSDNDVVQVANLSLTEALDIQTGSGQDFVQIKDSFIGNGVNSTFPDHLFVQTGVNEGLGNADKDQILLEGVRVYGLTGITTGDGDDVLTMKNSIFGNNNQDNVSIGMGAGADTVNLGIGAGEAGGVGSTAGFFITTGFDSENDADVVNVRDSDFDGTLLMQLGGGNDHVDMVNVLSRKDIHLQGMKGNDTMTLNSVRAWDAFFAEMGEGDDTLDMTYVEAEHLKADGGAGHDKLFRKLDPHNVDVVLTGWEEIDGRLTLSGLHIIPSRINGMFTRAS